MAAGAGEEDEAAVLEGVRGKKEAHMSTKRARGTYLADRWMRRWSEAGRDESRQRHGQLVGGGG